MIHTEYIRFKLLNVRILEHTECYVTGGITANIKVTVVLSYAMRPAILSAFGTENIVVCLGQ